MSSRFSRRNFLKSGAVAASLAAVNVSVPAFSADKAPSNKLNIAFVGVAGMRGADHYKAVKEAGENIIAMCDVDSKLLDPVAAKTPNAQKFQDFRKMLETVKDIDGVLVTTPDHTHAAPSVMAMKMGLHCYCEKPLAHDIREARYMQQVAAEKKVVTQMGTQIHAEDNYRRVVEMVQSGAVGKVHDVYVWCGKGWGMEPDVRRPTDTPAIPANINWDLWVGPAPFRPYHPSYLPANWRRWWDFGNGTLGDMAAHIMDLAFWALKLKNCKTIKIVDGPKRNPECCPLNLEIDYTFEADGEQPAVNLHWLDDGKRPEILKQKNIPDRFMGVLFDGEKGQLFADYGSRVLYPEANFKGYKAPEQWIKKSLGHHKEWLQAIRDNKPEDCLCKFSYGGRLTETILLGALAYRTGEDLVWDADAMKTNSAAANALLEVPYRDGWTL